jgi:hypothetical protein
MTGFSCAETFASDGLLSITNPEAADLSADIDYWLEQAGHTPESRLRPGQVAGLKEWKREG